MKGSAIWNRVADVAGLVATPLVPAEYLALFRPHAGQARVASVDDETAGVRTLTLRPARGWKPHRPGQHVRVQLAVDGRLATRIYSISSAATVADTITITVKAQGRVSRALHAVRPGDHVALGPPEGDFVVPEAQRGPLLFVTAGSGITPIASMLRTFAARGAMPDIVHVHYARTAHDVIFGDELQALAAAHPCYRPTIVHTRDDRRRFSVGVLDELVPDWRTREAWACGPEGLLASVTACFAHAGRAEALHVERFTAAFAPVAEPTADVRVRFVASGTETRADGRTPLLRVAETAGVCAPHGCRMGICHSCDATLLSGCVRDLRTGQLVEPGARVQICVCAAAGDVDLGL